MIRPKARVAEEKKYALEFEQRLLARIKGGEKEAFAELVDSTRKKSLFSPMDFFATVMMPWKSCRRPL